MAAQARPRPATAGRPGRCVRRCLCLAFPLPSLLRGCLCLASPVPALLRHLSFALRSQGKARGRCLHLCSPETERPQAGAPKTATTAAVVGPRTTAEATAAEAALRTTAAAAANGNRAAAVTTMPAVAALAAPAARLSSGGGEAARSSSVARKTAVGHAEGRADAVKLPTPTLRPY